LYPSSQSSEPHERVIIQDGHEFHELILNHSKDAHIDDENENEEYADRFTAYSDSSDEFTRSEASTAFDGRSQIFSKRSQRNPGQSRPTRDVFGRKRANSQPKVERIKKQEKDLCRLCHQEFNPRIHILFMCKSL
jgi:hypothetical protein